MLRNVRVSKFKEQLFNNLWFNKETKGITLTRKYLENLFGNETNLIAQISIDLSDLSIEDIEIGTFDGLTNLLNLSLANNQSI